MPRALDEWFESLTEEEQDRFKRNLLREPEEHRDSPSERMRRGFDREERTPREVREERRGKGGGTNDRE